MTTESCHLFGLKGGGQCKALLTTNCQLTILHAGKITWCQQLMHTSVVIEMRRSSAKGIVMSCHVKELEDCDQWQIVDPFDTTTGARLHHSNSSESSLSDDEVPIRKRKLKSSSSRKQKKRKLK